MINDLIRELREMPDGAETTVCVWCEPDEIERRDMI